MDDFTYRRAAADDVAAIAALHADSWRRHYRGAYADEYLDGPVFDERLALWTERFVDRTGTTTVVADRDGELVGFVHLIYDADPEFGPLVDNLHVRHDIQGAGAGRELIARAAQESIQARPGKPMHLWVLEQNTKAQAFYDRLGGEQTDRRSIQPPGTVDFVEAIRIVWPKPATLLT
jgi:ribosomal protein S18 acetylase RimI-like enzyme